MIAKGKSKHILTALFITASLWSGYAAAAGKPWWVTELKQEGVSVCDGGGAWSYKVTWKPIIYENRPWPKYKVGGNGCRNSTYTCTAALCTAQISMCGTKMSGSWTGVTADIGVAVSGVRAGVMAKPLNCK